jgi:predicted  nucleic acid-binding Zn-ribbon protein
MGNYESDLKRKNAEVDDLNDRIENLTKELNMLKQSEQHLKGNIKSINVI